MKRPMTINPFIQVTGWRSALPGHTHLETVAAHASHVGVLHKYSNYYCNNYEDYCIYSLYYTKAWKVAKYAEYTVGTDDTDRGRTCLKKSEYLTFVLLCTLCTDELQEGRPVDKCSGDAKRKIADKQYRVSVRKQMHRPIPPSGAAK